MKLVLGALRTSFWSYVVPMVLTPRRAFEALMHDPARLRLGAALIGMKAAAYTLVVLLLYLGDVPIMIPAWIAIPAERYFFWEIFFIAPVTLGGWILAAGVVQLSSTHFGGTGRFEDVLATTAFAITLASLARLLPDFLVGLLTSLGLELLDPLAWAATSMGPNWRTVIWSYFALYLVALLVLYPIATAAATGLRKGHALSIGLLGAVVYQVVYFIFIR